MKNVHRLLSLSFLIITALAMAQVPVARPIGKTIPTCNAWDTTGTVPVYNDGINPATTMCTDIFGKANYANSPLPKGPLDISASGFTIIDGGAGYTAPTVTIDDYYGTPGAGGAVCTAQLFGDGIGGISCTSAGADYVAPVVTINDPTGSGAIVLAKLDAAAQLTGGITGGLKKFVDPMPDLKGALAAADINSFPGSDYYEIALVETTWQMHRDLPPTVVRGYVQVPTGTTGCPAPGSYTFNYLGPVILAQKNRAVRVKFTNCLPTGAGGDLFIPTDTTYMGAGMGPDGMNIYLQNRATLHLHGGNTPWISDGTPHQWTIPVGETSTYPRGDSTRFVPDMWFDASGTLLTGCQGQTTCAVAGATNDPGIGSMTFYWTNEQSGRLMFYHDHAYGTTRLNVYVGEAAGYLLYDPAEEAGLLAAGAPGTIATNATQTSPDLAHLVPLVIQDRTFVPGPDQLAAEDPTWVGNWGKNGLGDLWFPHVYAPNQNPADQGGSNAFGRWDYGPWFFPPQTALDAAGPNALGPNGAVTIPCTSAAFPGLTIAPAAANNYKDGCPIIPNPSGTPEGFMDTPIVNGKAYPVLHVKPEAYRFRILNAANDRAININLYQACGFAGTTAATICNMPGAAGTEVPMVPAVKGGLGTTGYTYPDQLDGRDAGVPDRTAAGPSWLQIGTEGGILPNLAVIPPTPIGYEYGRRSITVLNVSNHGLFLGPAERADAIVDFSAYAGKTLIVYNDAPAPVPAFDSRIDYYTNDMDQVQEGGAPTTIPGYGPNTRTIMQIIVDPGTPSVPFSQSSVQAGLPAIFKTEQPQIIVPEPTYPVASNGNSPTATYGKISDDTITFTPVGGTSPITYTYDQKAIQELFTLDYGRMNATLGTELPLTNFLVQTTLPFGYAEWATEIMQDGQTQLWKLTHNGVDTHFIHFHLFNVQVVNRIGWDGVVKPPDANELGWKDTVRMNPLEDIVFAIQPFKQNLPWPLPDSIRLLDPTMPAGTDPDPIISGIDPATGNAIPGGLGRHNALVNFGQEYVWHCHILGHEENDMMRPIIFQAAPPDPSLLGFMVDANGVTFSWQDNAANETSYEVQKDTDPAFGNPVNLTPSPSLTSAPNTAFGGRLSVVDPNIPAPGAVVYYRVRTVDDYSPNSPLTGIFQTVPMMSNWVSAQFVPQPIATVTPLLINFGNQLVNTTSAPQSVTLTNTGGAPLVLDPAVNAAYGITLTGANPGDFATSNCPASLAPGASCVISLTFTPTLVGPRAATLNIGSNDPINPTIPVALSGTGVSDTTIAINAPAINYGQNGSVTVTVSGVGGTPAGDVSLTVDNGAPVVQTLDNTGATTFTITAPAVGSHPLVASYAAQGFFNASTANGTLVVNAAALTITVSSANVPYGSAPPAITASYAGFVNGDTVATAVTTAPTCSTTATSASPVGNYPSSCSGAVAPNYTISYVPGTVAVTQLAASVTPNAATKVYGQADPVLTGALNGFLPQDGVAATYSRTAGETVGNYVISATLAPSAVLSNYAITYNTAVFSITKAGSTTTITAHAPNPSLFNTAVTVSFSVVSQFGGLATGNVTVTSSSGESCTGALGATGTGSCVITLLTPGVKTLTATYAGDANVNGSASAAVNHTVNGPVASVNPTSLNFPNTAINTSNTLTAVLRNSGNTALSITGVTITGPNAAYFTRVNGGCGTSLAAGRTCNINVRFRPTATGLMTATLTINNNDPVQPALTVALSGTGVGPAVTLSPTSLNFGTQPINTTSAPQTISLTNSGNAPLSIGTISLGGTNANQFAQTNNCPVLFNGTLAPGASCQINVTFRPTARRVRNATVVINDNAVPARQTVPLTGTGQ
jgi:FtsP/CotA-like multicopper oxidase with cupredoxin domain